jgi:hypothetical protein
MSTQIVLSGPLERELLALTGKHAPSEAIRELTVRELMRRKTAHSLCVARFEQKYGASFADFDRSLHGKEPDAALEHDYMEWELSVTALEDINRELQSLS